jgi:hypothetical protein
MAPQMGGFRQAVKSIPMKIIHFATGLHPPSLQSSQVRQITAFPFCPLIGRQPSSIQNKESRHAHHTS